MAVYHIKDCVVIMYVHEKVTAFLFLWCTLKIGFVSKIVGVISRIMLIWRCVTKNETNNGTAILVYVMYWFLSG